MTKPTASTFARKVAAGVNLNDETFEDARVFVGMFIALHDLSYAEFAAACVKKVGDDAGGTLCAQTVQRFCEFDTTYPFGRSVVLMLRAAGIKKIRGLGS